MADSYTLKSLHEALRGCGVDVSYSRLSELMQTGDMAAQLGVTGPGNRREFPPETLDTLTRFFPVWRIAGGRLPHAPELLRLVREKGEGALMVSTSSALTETREQVDTPPSALLIAEATGRAEGLAREEEVLTAEEAAVVLKCSVALLHRNVPESFRLGKSTSGKRWRKSEILRIGEGEKR